ncbi:MAG: pseudouridine synthase, partial [Bacteroidota bacterium]
MLVLDTHIVGLLTHPVRLSDYAIGIFDAHLPSRKSVKKAILKGALIVNGEVGMTATWITTGDQIELIAIDEPTAQVFELDLEVIYEDDYLALINKPGGIPIHGHQLRTLTNALPYNIKYSTQKDALASMRPVHRLDAATCGLLLVAKTKRTQIDLSRQFQEKKVSKVYTALVCGKLENNGSIEL